MSLTNSDGKKSDRIWQFLLSTATAAALGAFVFAWNTNANVSTLVANQQWLTQTVITQQQQITWLMQNQYKEGRRIPPPAMPALAPPPQGKPSG